MELSKMKKEELELLSYTELTKMILEEEGKPLNTPTVFKRICELLDFTDDDYANKIGDYYTSLTTDKRFIFLEDGTWDLKDNHKVEIVLDEDDETEEEVEEEETLEVEEEDSELDYNTLEEGVDEDDDASEEMEDLSIIDDELEDEEE